MAGYVPAAIISQLALTATPGTSLLTGSGGTTYIIRTLHVGSGAAGKTATFSVGADSAATRLLDAYALAQNVPAIFNGWWEKAGAGAHDFDGNCAATAVNLGAYGYTFT